MRDALGITLVLPKADYWLILWTELFLTILAQCDNQMLFLSAGTTVYAISLVEHEEINMVWIYGLKCGCHTSYDQQRQ